MGKTLDFITKLDNVLVTDMANRVQDEINTIDNGKRNTVTQTTVDRSNTSTTTNVMDTLLNLSPKEFCDFDAKMDAFMKRLMSINISQRQKTLDNLGINAALFGESNTVTPEAIALNYSYVKSNNNYLDFVKKVNSYPTRAEKTSVDSIDGVYTHTYNLYPDELGIGHSNGRNGGFGGNLKWETNDKNSILYKTKQLFKQHKINTLISRFGTKADGDSFDLHYNGSKRTKYGESRGRNLLKNNPEKKLIETAYAINGYNNPYCRVWTHHYQYDRYYKTIRPFHYESYDGEYKESKGIKEIHDWSAVGFTGRHDEVNNIHSDYRNGNEGWEYSVLDTTKGGDGIVKIAPKYKNGKDTNVHPKDCMFSIENLAWRDYDPYSFEKALSWEQRGPLGGRIMWFPPYGIQFNESTSVKWSNNTFIGRGEDVYTYINTARAGTLSFLMVVDHPSIIDYAMYGDNTKVSETDMLRFFAGCDPMDPKDTNSIMSKLRPTHLTDEYTLDIKNVGQEEVEHEEEEDYIPVDSSSVPAQVEVPVSKTLNICITMFFPNNYSGVDDGWEDAMKYIQNGVGVGQESGKKDISQFDGKPGDGYEILPFQTSEDKTYVSGISNGNYILNASNEKIFVRIDKDKLKQHPFRVVGKNKKYVESVKDCVFDLPREINYDEKDVLNCKPDNIGLNRVSFKNDDYIIVGFDRFISDYLVSSNNEDLNEIHKIIKNATSIKYNKSGSASRTGSSQGNKDLTSRRANTLEDIIKNILKRNNINVTPTLDSSIVVPDWTKGYNDEYKSHNSLESKIKRRADLFFKITAEISTPVATASLEKDKTKDETKSTSNNSGSGDGSGSGNSSDGQSGSVSGSLTDIDMDDVDSYKKLLNTALTLYLKDNEFAVCDLYWDVMKESPNYVCDTFSYISYDYVTAEMTVKDAENIDQAKIELAKSLEGENINFWNNEENWGDGTNGGLYLRKREELDHHFTIYFYGHSTIQDDNVIRNKRILTANAHFIFMLDNCLKEDNGKKVGIDALWGEDADILKSYYSVFDYVPEMPQYTFATDKNGNTTEYVKSIALTFRFTATGTQDKDVLQLETVFNKLKDKCGWKYIKKVTQQQGATDGEYNVTFETVIETSEDITNNIEEEKDSTFKSNLVDFCNRYLDELENPTKFLDDYIKTGRTYYIEDEIGELTLKNNKFFLYIPSKDIPETENFEEVVNGLKETIGKENVSVVNSDTENGIAVSLPLKVKDYSGDITLIAMRYISDRFDLHNKNDNPILLDVFCQDLLKKNYKECLNKTQKLKIKDTGIEILLDFYDFNEDHYLMVSSTIGFDKVKYFKEIPSLLDKNVVDYVFEADGAKQKTFYRFYSDSVFRCIDDLLLERPNPNFVFKRKVFLGRLNGKTYGIQAGTDLIEGYSSLKCIGCRLDEEDYLYLSEVAQKTMKIYYTKPEDRAKGIGYYTTQNSITFNTPQKEGDNWIAIIVGGVGVNNFPEVTYVWFDPNQIPDLINGSKGNNSLFNANEDTKVEGSNNTQCFTLKSLVDGLNNLTITSVISSCTQKGIKPLNSNEDVINGTLKPNVCCYQEENDILNVYNFYLKASNQIVEVNNMSFYADSKYINNIRLHFNIQSNNASSVASMVTKETLRALIMGSLKKESGFKEVETSNIEGENLEEVNALTSTVLRKDFDSYYFYVIIDDSSANELNVHLSYYDFSDEKENNEDVLNNDTAYMTTDEDENDGGTETFTDSPIIEDDTTYIVYEITEEAYAKLSDVDKKEWYYFERTIEDEEETVAAVGRRGKQKAPPKKKTGYGQVVPNNGYGQPKVGTKQAFHIILDYGHGEFKMVNKKIVPYPGRQSPDYKTVGKDMNRFYGPSGIRDIPINEYYGDAATNYNCYREWKNNRNVGRALAVLLRNDGFNVHEITNYGKGQEGEPTAEFDTELNIRTRRANEIVKKYGAKNCILISIHSNGAAANLPNGWTTGHGWCAIHTVKGNKGESGATLAKYMVKGADATFVGKRKPYEGWRYGSDGIYIGNYAMTRDPLCPAVITENFYHNNLEDLNFITSHNGHIAVITANYLGIIKYFNEYYSNGGQSKSVLKGEGDEQEMGGYNVYEDEDTVTFEVKADAIVESDDKGKPETNNDEGSENPTKAPEDDAPEEIYGDDDEGEGLKKVIKWIEHLFGEAEDEIYDPEGKIKDESIKSVSKDSAVGNKNGVSKSYINTTTNTVLLREWKTWEGKLVETRAVSREKEQNIYRYDQEYHFFKALAQTDKLAYSQLIDKIRYFDPAFHSMTPEGFNARLTFLNQCTRQGNTMSASDKGGGMKSASNMAFGRPPFCVLRIGDFYNQMIVMNSVNIDYSVSDGIQWDLNTEGIGMQPLLARVEISFNFIGGGDIEGPVRRLQNAMTFNYYANTRFYDNRADKVKYNFNMFEMGAIDHKLANNGNYAYLPGMWHERENQINDA